MVSGDSRKRLEKNKTIRVYAGSDEDLSSVTFTILGGVGKGSYSVCYEAEELQQNKKGVLKEFYPEKYALQMKRTDEGQLCISPECIGTEVHYGFLEERKAYIEAHENLQKIQNDKAYADIGEFIPRIEIYRGSRNPDNADASVYLFMQGPQVISFKDICVKERAYMYDSDPHSCLGNLLRSVRTLAQAVGYLHEHDLLFMDIKPDNIGFVKTERVRKGYFPEKLQILDLDAIRPMIQDDDERMRGTEEFWDPMIAYGATAQTDIYAIGVTLFKAVIFTTEEKIESKYEDRYYNRLADLVKESKLIKNCSEEAQNQITAILKQCLCDNSDPSGSDRYTSCDKLRRDLDSVLGMLRCEDDICSAEGTRDRAVPAADYRLQTNRIKVAPGFGGREEELQRMEGLLLEENTSVLFLQGIGGIGKSELAKNYAMKHRNNKRCNKSDYTYDQIVFLTYSGNLCSTVSAQMNIKGLIRGREESDENFFGRKMEILPDITDENTLFIVDNFDVDNDKDLEAFLDGGDYTVIFTTRNPHPAYETLEIGTVGDISTSDKEKAQAGMQKMIEVFERHRFGRNSKKKLGDTDRESIEELIRLVEGHTYAVELLAKKMRADSLSGQQLLDEYRQGLRNQQGSSVFGYIDDEKKMRPFDHICAVFDVSHIGTEEQQLLRELSLMDLRGISVELLKGWTQVPKLMEGINRLEGRGLLRKDGEHGEIISLHPLVREVVQAKLEPNAKNCSVFLENLGHWLYDAWGRPDEENQPAAGHVRTMARYFLEDLVNACGNEPERIRVQACRILRFEERKYVVLWNMLPSFLWQVGDFENSIKYGHILYDICVSVHGKESMHTGYTAKALGACYHNSLKWRKSMKWYWKGLEYMLASGEKEDDELALAYKRAARCYTWEYEQNLPKAFDYIGKTLEIRKSLLERLEHGEQPDYYKGDWRVYDLNFARRRVASTYNERGRFYLQTKEYENALQDCKQASEIMDKLPEVEDTTKAYVHYNYAVCRYYLGIEQRAEGKYEEANENLNTACEILKDTLKIQRTLNGMASQNTLDTEEYLADTYAALGRIGEAIDCYEDSCLILTTYFPDNQEALERIQRKQTSLI